jgi:uncharacterized membrane protein YdbT with pleckstrin-like domain
VISEESELIKRHKNPLGILLRVFIYPVIAYGVWNHNLVIIGIGCTIEFLNWRAMPAVEHTYAFIQEIITIELRWLNAKKSVAKTISIILLVLFIVLVLIGLWFHSALLIVGGFF